MRDTATRGRMAEEAMREIQSRPTAKPTDVPESTPKHLAICTDCNNPMDNCRCEDWIAEDDQPTPAASPVAPPESELDKEIARWQKAIYDLCREESGDDTIDGGGCDSGDPLDFTLSEISEAFGIIKDKLASPVAGGSAENCMHDVLVGDPVWAMQNSDGTIRLALDCGDGGFIKMTPAQAEQIRDTLNEFLVPEGWVKVTPETMPPECTVIVCDTSRVVHIAVYRPKSDEYRWDCDTYGLHASDVTHWRPFPVPPAAEEERSSL